MGFESEAHVAQEKNKQPSLMHDQLTEQKQAPKPISVFPSHQLTAEKVGNRSFQPWPTLIQKVVHALLSNSFHNFSLPLQINSLTKILSPVLGSSPWLFLLQVLEAFLWLFFEKKMCQRSTPPIHNNPPFRGDRDLAFAELSPLAVACLPASVCLSPSWRTELISIAFSCTIFGKQSKIGSKTEAAGNP